MDSDTDYVEEIYEQPYEIARKQLSVREPLPKEKQNANKKNNRLLAVFLALSIVWLAIMTAWAVFGTVEYIKNGKETRLTLVLINESISSQAESLLELMVKLTNASLSPTNNLDTTLKETLNNSDSKTAALVVSSKAVPNVTTAATLKVVPNEMPKVVSTAVSTTLNFATTQKLATAQTLSTTLKPATTESQLPSRGFHPSNPATSCSSISNSHPSGFYWLLASNGSTVSVFCHMVSTCGAMSGGWMRVAHLDTEQSSAQCPSGLCRRSRNPRACSRCFWSGLCVSQTYQVGVAYSRVCGRIIGYQKGSVEAYSSTYTNGFDGVRLTYGNPGVNIWTFYAAIAENYFEPDTVCPCINPSDNRIPPVPSFVGSHYFCDTAASTTPSNFDDPFYSEDPLWDGAGCSGSNMCCSFNNPPWFKRNLPSPTTDNIRMQVCLNLDQSLEDIAIEKIDIYVQ